MHPTKQAKQRADMKVFSAKACAHWSDSPAHGGFFPSNGEGQSLAKLETLNQPKGQRSKSWLRLAPPTFPTAKQVVTGL